MVVQKSESVGLFICLSLVAGNIIGSGIYVLPAVLADYGVQGIIIWSLATLSAMAVAIIFSRLSAIVRSVKSGGPYNYAREAYGPVTGFFVGWAYWISVWAGNATITITFAIYLSKLVPVLSGYEPAVALCLIWTLTLINLAGLRVGGTIQGILFIGKMIPLVAIILFALPYTDLSNIETVVPLVDLESMRIEWWLIMSAFMSAWWGFLGLETATVITGNVRKPHVTLPLATLLGVGIAAITYCLITLVTMGNLSHAELQGAEAPLVTLGVKLWGNWSIAFVTFGAVVACLGTANGWVILQGHILMTIADDKLLPKFVGARNSHGAPVAATLLTTSLITALLIFTARLDFIRIFSITSLTSVVAAFFVYLFCCYGEVLYRRRHNREPSIGWFPHTLALVGFISCTFGVLVVEKDVMIIATALIVAGIPCFAYGYLQRH